MAPHGPSLLPLTGLTGEPCSAWARPRYDGVSETPSVPASLWPQAEARACAVHEAAHAVVATATGYGRVRSVSIEGEFGTFGRVVTESINDEHFGRLIRSNVGRRYVRAALLTTVAGPAAQGLIGKPCEKWAEDEDAVADGYPPDEGSDYGQAVRMAELLGASLDGAWEEAVRFVRVPEVWGAIEGVAGSLLALRERGRPATLDEAGYREAVGAGYAALEALAYTSPEEAVAAAARW